MLEKHDLTYRHGEDADFEAELALDRRIRDYVGVAAGGGNGRLRERLAPAPTGRPTSPPRSRGAPPRKGKKPAGR